MRRTFLLSIFLVTTGWLFSQSHGSKVNITSQEFNNRIELYATNSNPIPVSILLDFKGRGLTEQKEGAKFKVVPSVSPPQLVATLIKEPNVAWTYRYDMKVYLGNFYTNGHDTSYVYSLPFEKGQSYYLSQGYEGSFSHQNENAIDFVMPEGTEIMAIREGIVAEITEHNDDGCPYKSCMKMANSILIYHPDGTFSTYAHLQKNGALVEVGDQVAAGDLIGLSGNTGWSSEPHLHFSVFEIAEGNVIYSIPTPFYTEEGVVYLEEKRDYRRPTSDYVEVKE